MLDLCRKIIIPLFACWYISFFEVHVCEKLFTTQNLFNRHVKDVEPLIKGNNRHILFTITSYIKGIVIATWCGNTYCLYLKDHPNS